MPEIPRHWLEGEPDVPEILDAVEEIVLLHLVQERDPDLYQVYCEDGRVEKAWEQLIWEFKKATKELGIEQ